MLLNALCTNGQIKLAGIFADSMVLQRDQPIPIWGWATPGEKITVKINRQQKKTKADRNGKWIVNLDAEKAGGPFVLSVSGNELRLLKDIYIGDVWFCSGQSNMQMTVQDSKDADQEIENANYPLIRHIEVPRKLSESPLANFETEVTWQVATPATVGKFTAVGYFFARHIVKNLEVPVGIVNASWGGTIVETWTSKQSFADSEHFKWIGTLPPFNPDAAIAARKAHFTKMVANVQGTGPDSTHTDNWKKTSFNDQHWPTILLPGAWETHLNQYDGTIWFRKIIDIAEEDAGKPAVLSLGVIDEADETFVNEQFVGGQSSRGQRLYNIPAGVLKAGENSIVVKVEDNWGEGGIVGNKSELYLKAEKGGAYTLSGNWRFQVSAIAPHLLNISPNNYPSLLFNGMVSPVLPFAIRGVLWYQGESNAHWAEEYREKFPLLINDWRKHWKQQQLPFYYVQLTSFNADNGNDSNKGSSWAELREAQSEALRLPHTAMAVTTDIGDRNDIHPLNKQDIGKRLALLALKGTYQQNIVSEGPSFKSMNIVDNAVTVNFSHAEGGLVCENKYGYLQGFELAGADKKFFFAQARIEGEKVIVSSDQVLNPVTIRYAWADDATEANLYNKSGLPAAPFRSDRWTGITEERKFKF